PSPTSKPMMNGSASSKPIPTAVPVPDNTALGQALQVTRDSLAALQRMQEQTAHLHRQFLEGQDTAQRTVQVLVEQQQRLLQASLGWPVSPALTASVPALPAPMPSLPAPQPSAPMPAYQTNGSHPVLAAPALAAPLAVQPSAPA